MVDPSTPVSLHLRLTLDGNMNTLELENNESGERLPLASVATKILRTGPAAQAAWRTLCAEAITAAELAALGVEGS